MWYEEEDGGGVRLTVRAKPVRSMEWHLDEPEEESGWFKKEPRAKQSYPVNSLCPVRHQWTWESGSPECYARIDHWDGDYLESLEIAQNGDERRGFTPLAMALSGVEWGALAEAAPLRLRKHLNDMPNLWRSAPLRDSYLGGNLMFHAGRRGDTMLCLHLIKKGFGSLVGVEAYGGRTAYEIALESGFPDTAFVLEPYAAIRSPDRKWRVDQILLEELQYVVDQRGAIRMASERKPNIMMRCINFIKRKVKGPKQRITQPPPRPSQEDDKT